MGNKKHNKQSRKLLQQLVNALEPCMPRELEDVIALHLPLSVHGSDVLVAYTAAKHHLEKDK